MTAKLIVALDMSDINQAFQLIDTIDPATCALKIGSEMFTYFGPGFIKQLVSRNFPVFLDLKFHDIPNTVANACKACADLGVWMLNVHALGGLKMMQAAKQALVSYGKEIPLLIAVTVLTSHEKTDLLPLGISLPLQEEVKELALLAKAAGLDGVVSSAHEVASIKDSCGPDFLTVTPGIRPRFSGKNDQHRTMTPEEAQRQGSDYLVIGRPITQAREPAFVIAEILKELQ